MILISRKSKYLILTIFAVLATVEFWWIAWISDDAMITLRQVYMLAKGHGIVWNIGQRVQAFTHPLWFLLLELGYLMTGSLYWMTLILSALMWAGALVVYAKQVLAKPGWERMLLLFMPLLPLSIRDFTSSGLENPLSFLLAALVFTQKDKALWLVLAALVLTRPDHAVVFGPLAIWLIFSGKGHLKDMWPGILLLLGWHVFALIYFGMPLPNTYYAKVGGLPLDTRLLSAIAYGVDTVLHLQVSVFLLLVGLVAGLRGKGRDRWIAVGIVAHLVYLVWIGGDFMRGRFLSVDVFLACLLLVHHAKQREAWLSAVVVLMLSIFFTRPFLAPMNPSLEYFTDERRFYALPYSVRSPERAWPAPKIPDTAPPKWYRVDCGLIGGARIKWPDSIWIVDACGLTDPFIARLPAVMQPGIRPRPGHILRALPRNYAEVLGKNAPLSEPSAQALFTDIQTITKGPLWTSQRWAAIWRLLIHADQPDLKVWRKGGKGLIVGNDFWLVKPDKDFNRFPPGLLEYFEPKRHR